MTNALSSLSVQSAEVYPSISITLNIQPNDINDFFSCDPDNMPRINNLAFFLTF